MLITESMQYGYNRYDAMDLLDDLGYVNESALDSISTIPILESSSVRGYIVPLESIVEYAEQNGVQDLGYVLSGVCEANDVNPQSVVLSVQEENVIGDPEIQNITESLLSSGYNVYAKPLSENCNTSVVLNTILEYTLISGDITLLEDLDAASKERFNKIFEKAKSDPEMLTAVKRLRQSLQNNPGPVSIKDYTDDQIVDRAIDKFSAKRSYSKGEDGSSLIKDNTDSAPDIVNQINKFQYEGMNWPRKKLAQILSWLYRKSAEFNNKLHKKGVEEGKIPWYKKILSMITRAIESVSRKLHNAVSDKNNQFEEIKRDWNFKTQGQSNSGSNGGGEVKLMEKPINPPTTTRTVSEKEKAIANAIATMKKVRDNTSPTYWVNTDVPGQKNMQMLKASMPGHRKDVELSQFEAFS